MQSLDPAEQWLRLTERYRQMTDEELTAIARRNSELTDVAQQALKQEISHRGLKLQPEQATTPTSPEPDPNSEYAGDRELVDLCTVWSLSDALQMQTLLDRAGIPFFIGPEKATGVDAVTSNFANGVSVQIMSIGSQWAHQALQNYKPSNAQGPKEEDESDLAIHCPKCHSAEVTFEGLIPESAATTDNSSEKYGWTCDSCAHRWEDDGVVTED
jgi:DNA-directed RNA polymerase subunit M/transcription elongation factor TFIIS